MSPSVDADVWFGSDGTISISATPDELVALSRALSNDTDVVINLSPSVPASPYIAAADGICIRIESEPGVAILQHVDKVVISGHPEALGILAGNIARLARDPATFGARIHIEYFPEHFYVRAGSVPLIVAVT